MAKEYRFDVEMNASPFEFDNSEPTIVKSSELEAVMKKYGGRKKIEKKAEEKVEKK